MLIYYFLHFAITAWPFLNFYGSEINHKLVSLSGFSFLFIIIWGGSLLTCELLKKMLRTTSERILVGYTFFVLLFFNYSHLSPIIQKFHLLKPIYSFFIVLLIIIFAAYRFSTFTVFQKSIKIFIFAIFSFSCLENIFISLNKEGHSPQKVQNSNTSYVFKEKPSIYFLLLDTYPRSDVLKKNIQYNNEEFVNFFKNKGFLVAEDSHSNCSHTTPSLSATLQMNYLIKEEVNENDIFSTDKAVINIIKKNNYKFIAVPAYYDFVIPTSTADLIITPNSNLLFSLTNINFLQTTPLHLFTRLIRPFLYFGNNEIKKIFKLNKNEPKFVFIHYLQLHDFAYSKNCKIDPHLILRWPTVDEFRTNISCINASVKDTINEIMFHDPEGIIIVQGDHGPSWWRGEEEVNSLGKFDIIFSIFSAIYIPGLDKNSPISKYLSTSPSPVNNFRIIFSYLAKEPIELLPDKYFIVPYHDVTEKVHFFQNNDRMDISDQKKSNVL